MKTLALEIPDDEYAKLGIPSSAIAYDELLLKVGRQELRELFAKVNRNAELAGLGDMTEVEINSIINEVRIEMKNGKINP